MLKDEIQSYLHTLNRDAEGILIDPEKLIFEENVKMNCFYCGKYNNNWKCPPNLPDIDYKKRFFSLSRKANPDITDAISHATCTTAHDLNARAIITVSKSGRTARMVSKYRPACDIFGCTTQENIRRQLNLSWGITPILIQEEQDTFDLFENAIQVIQDIGLLKQDDLTVITAGVPLGISGTTNMIKVHTVGRSRNK